MFRKIVKSLRSLTQGVLPREHRGTYPPFPDAEYDKKGRLDNQTALPATTKKARAEGAATIKTSHFEHTCLRFRDLPKRQPSNEAIPTKIFSNKRRAHSLRNPTIDSAQQAVERGRLSLEATYCLAILHVRSGN